MILAVTFIGLTALSCAWLLDPINRLQAKIWDGPMWAYNGFFVPIKLGPKAKPEEILAQALHAVGFTTGPVRRYRILETKTIYVRGRPHSAVLFDSDQGRIIMWTRYEEVVTSDNKREAYWWEHFFQDP